MTIKVKNTSTHRKPQNKSNANQRGNDMKKRYSTIVVVVLSIAILCAFSTVALAITESDVEARISATSKEEVSGNVFIWFLCAIAFLKISQKIDSFMSSLGINVGHTGGNMLAEAMIAVRGVGEGRKIFGSGGGSGGFGSRGSRGASGSSGTSGADGSDGSSGGFMSGGLVGAVGRQINKSAVQNATGQGGGLVGGAAFTSSLENGGEYANSIVGKVAKGSVSGTGTMTGDEAVKGLTSYLGYTAAPAAAASFADGTEGYSGAGETPLFQENGAELTQSPFEIPQFSQVEIGGGRITGIESTEENPNGIQFGMYNTNQYMTPEGEHSVVETVDGEKWYKQYARDTVDKSPYMAPDGAIAYNESIVKKMPRMPQRKDRV